MRFTSAAVSAVLAATALAAPSTSLSSTSSIADAEAHGVDVFGPIPADAVKTPEGHYTAEEGTQAWRWIRAQIDIPNGAHPDDKVEKRQGAANIGIGMFAKDSCTGQAAWFDDVTYNVNSYATINMYSVGISYRGLRSNEQLDFSRLNGNDWCGTYLYSAGQNTPVGCFNSQAINCFRLWLH
ncbi:hypothetical protein ESCO_001602 [Escovopsis weberi]|uniref:Uncharacterized protein n=1 Tax=Escovopsis weberi TaxID=150374 RepID=A0A0M9VWQ8_ESCWE|nr:hypothetical protein ESCO_001602 [Escovopsis weberi]